MKYIIAAGGTGGHLNPALEIARSLRERKDEVIFVGSDDRLEKNIILDEFRIFHIKISHKRNLKSIYLIIIATIKILNLIKKEKIDRVISFGNYITVPSLIAAIFTRKKIFIHEQNIKMGLVNKLFSFFADKVFLSFDTVRKKNHIFTGLPIKQDFKNVTKLEARNLLKVGINEKMILVTGGSQGSKRINDAILRNINKFNKVILFWVTGKNNQIDLNKDNIKIFDYTNLLPFMIKASDVVISRAGASTIVEMISSRTLAVTIPYKSKKSDQEENSKYFSNLTKLNYFLDENLDEAIIYSLGLINENKIAKEAKKNLLKFEFLDATKKILEEI